jgi:hypothetical protein
LLATYTHHIRLNPLSPSTREVQGIRNEVFQQCEPEEDLPEERIPDPAVVQPDAAWSLPGRGKVMEHVVWREKNLACQQKKKTLRKTRITAARSEK